VTNAGAQAGVRAGEPPLIAFVSSVMDREMQPARDRVVNTLAKAPYLLTWAFEYTPASSQNVDWSYLEKVRQAAFVFWLVGSRTSEPVRAEVEEAISSQRRLIPMLLPSNDRDQLTLDLVEQARSHAKYREPGSLDELAVEIDLAVSDEIARALADVPGMGRVARLDELGRASRARCIERWQAAGVPTGPALDLAQDPIVGVPPSHVWPTAARPLTVMQADVGAGKSLTGERIHQRALETQLASVNAPVPVWLKASRATNLTEAALAAAEGLGDPRQQGAAIVVDGADEAGLAAGSELLGAARELVRTWPDTNILITSRPLPTFFGIEELVGLPPLGASASIDLVGLFAGREITAGQEHGWPPTLREAIKFPLFCVLLGSYLRRHESQLPASRAELLRDVVTETLAEVDADVSGALHRLAVQSLERGGGAVAESEVGRADVLDELVKTRLVVRAHGGVRFPLIIFAQWFAAESIVDGEPSIEELAGDTAALVRWLYPIAMAVGTYSHEEVSRLMSPLAEQHPGFASQIIEEGLAKWSRSDDETPAPPPEEVCGRRIRECTEHWTRSMQPLGQLLLRLDAEGAVRPIGVLRTGSSLTTGWHVGATKTSDITKLPGDAFAFLAGTPSYDWIGIRSQHPGNQSAWAWRWAQEDLRKALTERLRKRRLPLLDGPLAPGRLWTIARYLLNLTFIHDDPVPIEQFMRGLPADADVAVTPNGREVDVRGFLPALQGLLDEGRSTLDPPFPGPDRSPAGAGFIWNAWSEAALLERTRSVFSTALAGYEHFCQTIFAGLAPWMQTAATLPATLRGWFQAPRFEDGFAGSPTIEWWFEAREEGETSQVDLRVREDDGIETDFGADLELLERNRSLRPSVSEWLDVTVTHAVLDIYEPWAAEELALEWLWKDLAKIGWVEGMLLGSRPSGYGSLI